MDCECLKPAFVYDCRTMTAEAEKQSEKSQYQKSFPQPSKHLSANITY